MRRAVRFVRQFQSLLQHQGDCLNGFARRPNRLVDYNRLYAYRPTIDVAIDRYSYPSFIISRALSIDAAQVNSGDVKKGVPLVEYERRIAASELVDGDICQEEVVVVSFPSAVFLLSCDRTIPLWRSGHRENYVDGFVFRSIRHKGVTDPLEVVAGEICDESMLLCLEEFMVNDALLLNRLYRYLFRNGVILVATSNRAPDYLYEGGLQRDLFLPFISTLKAEQGYYFVGNDLSAFLKQKFQELVGEHTPGTQEVEVVMGRRLQIPLGAADYFGLFEKFHTLALEGVPIFAQHNRTVAYRFVTLVDVCVARRNVG